MISLKHRVTTPLTVESGGITFAHALAGRQGSRLAGLVVGNDRENNQVTETMSSTASWPAQAAQAALANLPISDPLELGEPTSDLAQLQLRRRRGDRPVHRRPQRRGADRGRAGAGRRAAELPARRAGRRRGAGPGADRGRATPPAPRVTGPGTALEPGHRARRRCSAKPDALRRAAAARGQVPGAGRPRGHRRRRARARLRTPRTTRALRSCAPARPARSGGRAAAVAPRPGPAARRQHGRHRPDRQHPDDHQRAAGAARGCGGRAGPGRRRAGRPAGQRAPDRPRRGRGDRRELRPADHRDRQRRDGPADPS